MTVCIAAICEDGRSCVVAADRMAQHGGLDASIAFTRENTTKKILEINDRLLMLHSGPRELADAMVAGLKEFRENEPLNKQLDRAIDAAIRELRDGSIRKMLGDGWSYERLCDQVGTASSGAYYEIWRNVTYLEFGSILTVSCAEGEIALHFTSSAQPTRKVGLPYLAIGTGSTDALTALKIQEYDKSAKLEECLLHVACAKRAAEFSYAVDGYTDMVVMTSDGVQEVPSRTIGILTDLRKARFHWRLDESEYAKIRASLSELSDD